MTRAIGITTDFITPRSLFAASAISGIPAMVAQSPKAWRASCPAGKIRFLIVGPSVTAMSISITMTIRGVNIFCKCFRVLPIESSVTAQPPINIAVYILLVFTASPCAASVVIIPTSNTDAGPTTIGIRCPQSACTMIAPPIRANTFCAYSTRSAGEPTAMKRDVTTTAMANTNHCKLYNISCPNGGRESIPYLRFIIINFLFRQRYSIAA